MDKELVCKLLLWIADQIDYDRNLENEWTGYYRLGNLANAIRVIAGLGLGDIALERNKDQCQNQPVQSIDAD